MRLDSLGEFSLRLAKEFKVQFNPNVPNEKLSNADLHNEYVKYFKNLELTTKNEDLQKYIDIIKPYVIVAA
jgi:FMN-dependent NADH-azoreductase